MDIAQLVADHHQAVYRYAFRLTGSAPDAEDLSQQVFLVANEKLGQLRNEERARNWLFAILRNHFLKQNRNKQATCVTDLRLNIDKIPQAEGFPEIDQEQLQRALDTLPDGFRIVLVMFYFEQLSYREMAEALGIPIGTVMSRLARAKGHLRSQLLGKDSTRDTADLPIPTAAGAPWEPRQG